MSDMLDSPGVRIGNELNVFLAADAKIRCLRDRIIVEPLDWRPSSIIFVAGYEGKPLRGIVRAVGPGCYPIQYQNSETGEWSFSVPKGKRKAMRPSKAFRPCDVKVGDIVEFGGLEIGGFLHPTIMWGHKEVVLCREEDVAGVVEQLGRCKCGCEEFTTGAWAICCRCGVYQEGPFKGQQGRPASQKREKAA